ncbi:MAG TPA: lysophospholipid acyltransferase family protein [Candidatus Saccharimonadales bacterium]|nr:lysophospholipid acyltransferase family protein [Candidatus Saccharimonadales bacterium]
MTIDQHDATAPSKKPRKPRSIRRRVWLVTWVLRHLILRPIARLHLFTTHQVEGAQFVPKEGGVIVAGNHPSTKDPVVLAATLNRIFAFLAKAELWQQRFLRMRVLKPFLNFAGQIPVDRGNRDSGGAAQASALRVLTYRKGNEDKGGVVVIFPEGGCTPPDGELKKFKYGVWNLARDSGAPVVPTGLNGTEKIKLRLSVIFRRRPPARVQVRFGEPLYARDFEGPDAAEQFMAELRNRIEALRS